jgi:Domain of unknown function (DUF5666)
MSRENREESYVTTQPERRSKKVLYTVVATGVVVCTVLGFVGGIAFQKGRQSTIVSQQGMNGFGQAGPGGSRFAGAGIGAVTAVSDSSITVQDERRGTTKTYAVTSATTVTNNNSTAVLSDIKVGDTVMIEASTSDSTQAARIVLNPQMMQPGSQSSVDQNLNTSGT